MANPKCNCEGCLKRRASRKRYFESHRPEVLATNAKARAKRKTRLSPEVSDEELDRRASERPIHQGGTHAR